MLLENGKNQSKTNGSLSPSINQSQEIIDRLSKKLFTNSIHVCSYKAFEDTNAIAAVFDPKNLSVKIYTEGQGQNPYKEVIEVK